MVAYHRPIPDSKADGKVRGALGAFVQAEKMMQIAILLPASAVVGWLIGLWLDRVLHQSWIEAAGIIFGGVAGLVYVVRLVMANAGEAASDDGAGKEQGKGSADKPS